MNWLMAHRTAGIAATNLRTRLGISEDSYIDVFEALRRCGLEVRGDDEPGLFGLYFPAMPGRYGGIFLNSTMSEATIRHTAGHELGHAEFGHQRCVAEGLDPFSGLAPEKWPDEEKQAEAFAAWFLMPIRLVKATLLRLGLDIPREAMDVYQLSLHLGASYRGTLRHLRHLRLVDPRTAGGWANVQPARLRARLSAKTEPTPPRIWELTGLTEGSRLAVEEGDRLIVRAPWLGHDPEFAGPAGVQMRPVPHAVAPGEGAEFDIGGPIVSESLLTVTARGSGETWSVTLMPTPRDHCGPLAAGRSDVLVGPASGARR